MCIRDSLLGEGQIAVYPVDVRGPLVGGVSAADNIGIAAGGGPIPSAPGQLSSRGDTAVSLNEASQQRMMQELTLRSAERSTMNQFAADTGGKAFFNSNAVEDAIATATEQGSSYYALSTALLTKITTADLDRLEWHWRKGDITLSLIHI